MLGAAALTITNCTLTSTGLPPPTAEMSSPGTITILPSGTPVPIDYGLVGGLSANAAGMRLIPITGGTALGSFVAGQLVSRTGRYRIFPVSGACSMTVLCAALAYLGLGHALWIDLAAT